MSPRQYLARLRSRTASSAGSQPLIFLEAAAIIDANRDPIASRRFDDLIKEAQISIESVTNPRLELHGTVIAISAKPIAILPKLNFGDCFGYALAKFTGEPLLSKGNHFAHTNI